MTLDCLEVILAKFGNTCTLASVAQLDARPTGDQEVAGPTPAWPATFFRGDLIMKYFLQLLFPFR